MVNRIINAVKTSGVLKERLFNVAYNSKKQAIMSGMVLTVNLYFCMSCFMLLQVLLFFLKNLFMISRYRNTVLRNFPIEITESVNSFKKNLSIRYSVNSFD